MGGSSRSIELRIGGLTKSIRRISNRNSVKFGLMEIEVVYFSCSQMTIEHFGEYVDINMMISQTLSIGSPIHKLVTVKMHWISRNCIPENCACGKSPWDSLVETI
jgi:hypothetical protein